MSAKDVTNHYRRVVQEENKEKIADRYRNFERLRDEGTPSEHKQALTQFYISNCSMRANVEEIAQHVEAIEAHLDRIKEMLDY